MIEDKSITQRRPGRYVLISFRDKLIRTLPSSYCNLRDNYRGIHGDRRVAGTCRYSSFAVQTMPLTPISFAVPLIQFFSTHLSSQVLSLPFLRRETLTRPIRGDIVRPCEEDAISRWKRKNATERSMIIHQELR